MEKKHKKSASSGKEASKLKKLVKAQEKEFTKVKVELSNQKALNEDYRAKIEELVKKGNVSQTGNYNSRPAAPT